jgi:hypothetical protein
MKTVVEEQFIEVGLKDWCLRGHNEKSFVAIEFSNQDCSE